MRGENGASVRCAPWLTYTEHAPDMNEKAACHNILLHNHQGATWFRLLHVQIMCQSKYSSVSLQQLHNNYLLLVHQKVICLLCQKMIKNLYSPINSTVRTNYPVTFSLHKQILYYMCLYLCIIITYFFIKISNNKFTGII